MKNTRRLLATILTTALIPSLAFAQATGSAGCSTITQAAANTVAARVDADDSNIKPPQAIKNLTCLDSFFKGSGLDVVTNLLNPTNLLQAIEGQVCNAITNEWQSALGNKQCGITLTGFNTGFLGGQGLTGFTCPKLSFGGGGPPIGYIGVGSNNIGTLNIPGTGLAPTGYTLPQTSGLW